MHILAADRLSNLTKCGKDDFLLELSTLFPFLKTCVCCLYGCLM